MGEVQPALVVASPLPPHSPPTHPPQAPACRQGHGSRAVVPPGWLPPSRPGLAPAASPHWLQGGGGRKAKCPHVLAGDSIPRPYGKWEMNRSFLQTQPHAQPGGEGSGGPGALLNPRGMGVTGAKLCARNILLWAVLGHLVFQEGLLKLLVRKRVGWCASVLQAGGHRLQTGKEDICSPFPPKTQTICILGYPTPKIREEITVVVGF